MLDCIHIVTLLEKKQNDLRALDVKSLALFGSVARDEAVDGSDIDILVSFFHSPVTFDAYMDVKFFLEDLLNNPVDLVVAESLHPRIKPFVHQDAVYVVA